MSEYRGSYQDPVWLVGDARTLGGDTIDDQGVNYDSDGKYLGERTLIHPN